jgi:prepilin-type N-terminal cleavage/methylation domain-containing protein
MANVKEPGMKALNERGFTLLEVMVAGAILAVGLLGIAGMMTAAVRGNDFGKRMTAAEYLAQQRMEQFKNLSYRYGKGLGYQSSGARTLAGCGTDADPDYSNPKDNIDVDSDGNLDPDDNAYEYEAYELEDYGNITDLVDETITYPHYRRETLVEAGFSASVNACSTPPTDRTANVTVMVKWKGVTGEHSVKVMSMLAR